MQERLHTKDGRMNFVKQISVSDRDPVIKSIRNGYIISKVKDRVVDRLEKNNLETEI